MARYIDQLLDEVALCHTILGFRPLVGQLHLGGGTPTWHTPEELARLMTGISQFFHFAPDAELSVEADPRVTTREHIEVLRGFGFNRISFGVQDVDPRVQAAIGRDQPWDATVARIADSRELGFDSINIDLVYGLPHQTIEGFEETIRLVMNARPDRLAVYGFAWVPWSRGHQKKLDQTALPAAAERSELLNIVREAALSEGYVDIGMDHFALPTDVLAIAQSRGQLRRNFMGYTTVPGRDMLGFGVSAISYVDGAYSVNHRKLIDWQRAIERSELPVERGIALTPDDLRRAWVISEIMCNFVVQRDTFEAKFGDSFDTYFADDLPSLCELISDQLVVDDGTSIRVVGLGQRLVRNVAMCFDAFTRRRRTETSARFSRTV